MKAILIFTLSLILLGACIREKEHDFGGEGCIGDGQISLSFVSDSYSPTKTFAGSGTTVAEKKVISAKIFIFKSGTKIFEKLLDADEITEIASSTPLTFTVPGMQGNTTYTYYVIINCGDIVASSVTDLQAIIESDIQSYNAEWSKVCDTAVEPNRPGGFVMTGNTDATTNSDLSGRQNVTVQMKRITAKLDITTTINPAYFGSGKLYEGSLTIDSVKVVNTQATTPLVMTTPTTTPGTLTLVKQVPNVSGGGVFENRFYVYENGPLAAGSRSLLNLYATYTNDGLSNPVLCTLELNPKDSNGAIVRNGAYAVNVDIKGLTGALVSLSITLGDWESLLSQDSSIGS